MSFPLAVWDFTLSVKRSSKDHLDVVKELEQLAKKWTFQLEKPLPTDEFGDVIYERIEEFDEEEFNEEHYEDDTFHEEDYEEDDTFDENDHNEYEEEYESSEYEHESDNESQGSVESNESQQGAYEHYQGRISLIKKKRKSELLSLLYENDFLLANAHWRPTTNNCMGNIFYCVKIDSRVAGPWTDMDEKPMKIPIQIKMIKELYPYQQEIIDRAKYCWSSRSINVLYDPAGCKGKSTLATYCGCHKIGRKIPCLNNYLDIMQCIMSMPISGLYFIDMPRAINKYKLVEFYAGIEDIKNGFCFDTRYKYTELYFDSPEIWLFTNVLPDTNMLSKDRWVVWSIQNNELFLYNNGEFKKGPDIVYPVEEEVEEADEEELDECEFDDTEVREVSVLSTEVEENRTIIDDNKVQIKTF